MSVVWLVTTGWHKVLDTWKESPRKFGFRRKSLKSRVYLLFDIFYQEFCWEVLFQIFFHDLRISERLHVFVSQKDKKCEIFVAKWKKDIG